MIALFKIFSLTILLSYVSCDWNTDATQVKQSVDQVKNLTEPQLYDYINSTFNLVIGMANKRAYLASQQNIKCYSDLYAKYGQFFLNYLTTFKQDISQITDSNQRMAALQGIASIAATMQWDEQYRAQHNNIPIETNVTECVLTLEPKFQVLLTTLLTGVKGISGASALQGSSYLSQFYSNLEQFFSNAYNSANTYALQQNTATQNKCLTVLDKEMERFVYLSTLQLKQM